MYLFTDNSWREYKNQYVLGLGHIFVHLHLFDKVKHGLLPVGHTHDWIVDGVFKHFARVLLRANCFTSGDLMRIIADSYTPKPIVIYVESLGAFSSLFLNYLESRIVGHTEPLVQDLP